MQTLLGGLRISEGLKEIVSFRSGALKPELITMMQSQYGAVLRNRRKGADKRKQQIEFTGVCNANSYGDFLLDMC
jgi:hypothetical protein